MSDMLIQALCEYADKHGLNDSDFKKGAVHAEIVIGIDGSFKSIESLMNVVEVQPKKGPPRTEIRPTFLLVPTNNRSSQIDRGRAGCDNINYVVGPNVGVWTEPAQNERYAKTHASFVEMMNEAANTTNKAEVRAVYSFLCSQSEKDKARNQLTEMKADGTFTIALTVEQSGERNRIIDDQDLKRFWKDRCVPADVPQDACLVDGKTGPIALIHNKVMGLATIGGEATGCVLVSSNYPSADHYGFTKAFNGPICLEHMSKYVMGLNDLLVPGVHQLGSSSVSRKTRSVIGSSVFCYWGSTNFDPISFIESPDQDLVKKLIECQENVGIEDFFLLELTATSARISIQSFIQNDTASISRNLADYFRGMAIANIFTQGEVMTGSSIFRLIRSLAPKSSKESSGLEASMEAKYGGMLLRRAISGIPLGAAFFTQALTTQKIVTGDKRFSPERLGVLRLALNDQLRQKEGKQLMTESMDDEREDQAYLLGILFAIFDSLQYASYKATGQKIPMNRTVTDNFYRPMMTSPLAVIGRLSFLATTWQRKLRSRGHLGLAHLYGTRISLLLEKIGPSIPRQMSLENQASFIFGYHHEKAEVRRKYAERKDAQQNDEERSSCVEESDQ